MLFISTTLCLHYLSCMIHLVHKPPPTIHLSLRYLSPSPPPLDMSICYDVNGVQTGATPCYNSITPGPCCEACWKCLSIGLCEPGPGSINSGNTAYYRASGCTDPTWQIEKCFNGCNSCMSRIQNFFLFRYIHPLDSITSTNHSSY